MCVAFKRNLLPYTGKVQMCKCKHWSDHILSIRRPRRRRQQKQQQQFADNGSGKIKNKNAFNIFLSNRWLAATTPNTTHCILHLILRFISRAKSKQGNTNNIHWLSSGKWRLFFSPHTNNSSIERAKANRWLDFSLYLHFPNQKWSSFQSHHACVERECAVFLRKRRKSRIRSIICFYLLNHFGVYREQQLSSMCASFASKIKTFICLMNR